MEAGYLGVGSESATHRLHADLPRLAFHGQGWLSTAQAKDLSPPFDPLAARGTPPLWVNARSTKRSREAWRDSSMPGLRVPEFRRRSAARSFPRAEVGINTRRFGPIPFEASFGSKRLRASQKH